MVMDHQPLVTDKLEKVRGKDLSVLRFVGLLRREILNTDDPGHIACHLYHHVGEVKLHRKGVVKDQHPRVSHSGPTGTNRPAWVNASDIVLMHPHLVHLGNVKALKCFVECSIGLCDGFDALL